MTHIGMHKHVGYKLKWFKKWRKWIVHAKQINQFILRQKIGSGKKEHIYYKKVFNYWRNII